MKKKKYTGQLQANAVRQELIELKKGLMNAKTVEETVPISKAIRDLKVVRMSLPLPYWCNQLNSLHFMIWDSSTWRTLVHAFSPLSASSRLLSSLMKPSSSN
jgi:hypothetical protein